MTREVDKTQVYIIILLLGYIAWLFQEWLRKRVVENSVDVVSDKIGHGSGQVSEATHSQAELKFVSRVSNG
jgi:hypothetical protein